MMMSWSPPWGLCHGHLPAVMGSPQDQKGCPRKGVGEEVSPAEVIPEPSDLIDGRAGSKLKGNDNTFSQLAGTALVTFPEGAKQAIELFFESTRRHPKRCRTTQTEVKHRTLFQEHSTGANTVGESYSGVPQKGKSPLKFSREEREKNPQHREKLEGKEPYVTCDSSASRSPKKSVGKGSELLSKQKKQTTPPSHALHTNLGKSLHHTAEDTDVWACVGMWAPQESPPTVPKAGEKPDKIPRFIYTLSRTWGAAGDS
ncbi:hypothetical protein GWK47_011635 [Chionoecetes opilio]|uniref:Uncharacterized protein n=1 Tax=Chionoecetes opilio TaxID=41210 RepID=A0A8J4Y651_CHIOP|nr:hypothetical protein GWK47_011635 [Chionoecetes opilio]